MYPVFKVHRKKGAGKQGTFQKRTHVNVATVKIVKGKIWRNIDKNKVFRKKKYK